MEFLDLDVENIVNEYKNGKSLRYLAKKYGTSKQTIKNRLLKNDINILSSSEYIIKNRKEHILKSNPCKKTYNIKLTDKAYNKKVVNNKKLQEFLNKAKEKFNDKFDYSEMVYINYNTLVNIICPVHGLIKIFPNYHLNNKFGCVKCQEDHRIKMLQDRILKRFKKIHGDEYDYSKFRFSNVNSKIVVICPKHGEFYPTLKNHLYGSGCKLCVHDSLKSNTKQFVDKSLNIHGDKFNYDHVLYVRSKDDVIIECPLHGRFLQRPNSHLNGHGCPICAKDVLISKAHDELIKFVSIFGFKIKSNDRKMIHPYELDIYIPSKRFAVEYNGVFWHSFNRSETKEEKNKHKSKLEVCLSKNIKLIQIFENEWNYKNNIVKSILMSKLGVIKNKIYARKCEVVELNSESFDDFCINNHIQGKLSTAYRVGLRYKGSLVCAIGFNKHKKHEWELTRFCNKIETVVVGGMSKLFKYFINDIDPNNIMTYADRRYSEGEIYKKLGFKLDKITDPGYFYVKNDVVYSRQKFQKHKLKNKLENFDPSLTEAQNMFNNGYRRLWDAGHFKFIWKK